MKHWYRNEYIRCGKATCKKCPHGPYWYEYWREDRKLHKKYIGKIKPEFGVEVERDPRDDIFILEVANTHLAREILDLQVDANEHSARLRYKVLVKMNHPDRGGDHHEMCLINAAWAYLCKAYGWR